MNGNGNGSPVVTETSSPRVLSISDWMNSSATANPLHNLAVVAARLANALARALNLQKLVVEDISTDINRLSDLSTQIIGFKSTSPTKKTAPFGKSAADAQNMIDRLKAEGIDQPPLPATAAAAIDPGVNVDDIGAWEQKLTAMREGLTNKSQQESLRLQTFTNRYTQSNDQASSVLQKDAQSKGTVANNLRG